MSKLSRWIHPLSLACGLALAMPTTAKAQAFDAVRLYGAAPGTDGGLVGIGAAFGTEYAGSQERRTVALPLLDYQWRNGWFAGTSNGIGYDFAQAPDMQYGLRITADFGRKESRSDALNGMGDIDLRPEIGGFLNYGIGRDVFLTSSLRYGSGEDRKGAVLDLGVGYSIEAMPGWRLGLGVAASVVNADYMQSYFGVTPAQSGTSGYAEYDAGAGVRDVRANLALTWQFHPRSAVTGAVSVSSLQGDARDSPLTRRRTTTTGLLALTYSF